MAKSKQHIVRTTHVQHLIENGLRLAKACDGSDHWTSVVVKDDKEEEIATAYVLEKAAADLRHAAEELTAERLSLMGWPQV